MNHRRNGAGYRQIAVILAALIVPVAAVGQSWVGTGPFGKNIRALAQSPGNPALMWAGAFGWGIFKSTDSGGTWVNDRTGLTNAHIRSLVALSDNLLFAGTNDGVFKSTNGGASWTSSHSTANSVRSLVYDSTTGAIYAATYGSGLFKTTNQGSAWSPIPVTDPLSGQTLVHQRAVAVFAPDGIYIGGSVSDIDSGGALFKSVNGGAAWTQVQPGTGIRSTIMSIAVSPTDPATTLLLGTAANGVYRSTNAGNTWVGIDAIATPNPLQDGHVNAVAFSNGYYHAGTDSTGKIFYRIAGDTSVGWLNGAGTPAYPVVPEALRVDRAVPSRLYAATEGAGVYATVNSGTTWEPANTGMLGIAARAVKINGNGTILLGTEFGDGIWTSTNQAASWTRAESLNTSNSITALATTSNASLLYAAAYGTGVYKSTNGGAWWTLTDSVSINFFLRALCVLPSNSSVVYAGTGNGVYRTIDAGAHWSGIGVGIPASTSIRCLTMDRINPSILYAGTDSSFLYRTTNGGSVWTHITSGFLPQDAFIRCITIDRVNPAVVFAGSDSGRVYKSLDHGSTWTPLARIATNNSVRSLLQSPNTGGVIFAATFGSGVYVSADGGVHWTTFSTGLPESDIFTLESDAANPLNMYAGTGAHGVFRTSYSYSNFAPVLAPVGNKSVSTGQTLAFTVSATDPEGSIPALTVQGLQPGATFVDSGNGSGRYDWTPSIGQVGVSLLTLIASDVSLADTERISVTVLDSTGNMTVTSQLEMGWNLISVPVVPADLRKTSLYPGAVSAAFAYEGGYTQRYTLAPGIGYWLKYPASHEVPLTGMPLVAETLSVAAGWNLVGSLSATIAGSGVAAVPPAAVLSPFYGFSPADGYAPSTVIMPGKGYWVKISQEGQLIIGGGVAGGTRQKQQDRSR